MSDQVETAFSNLLRLSGRSFNDAVVVSGIDARQLRNGLDRGILSVGEKLRIGRWAFTGRDLLELMIVHRLTSGTWMPISQAAQAAKVIAPHAERLLAIALKIGGSEEDRAIVEVIILRDQDQAEVIFHQRGDHWGFYDSSWNRLDRGNETRAHVRLPALGMFLDFFQSCNLAFEETE